VTSNSEGTAGFLDRLANNGVKLWIVDGRLRVNAPEGALTTDLREQLTRRKQELLDFLVLGTTQSSGSGLVRRPPGSDVLATAGQQRIWALSRLSAGSSVYNVPTVFTLRGNLKVDALSRVFARLAREHEILRSTFFEQDSTRLLIKIHSSLPVPVVRSDIRHDLAALSPKARAQALHQALRAEAAKPFDLESGPLWRVRLFLLGRDLHVLALTMHHIVFDGASKNILLSLISRMYGEELDSTVSMKPAPELHFTDFAYWESQNNESQVVSKQLEYWSQKLEAPISELNIANDRSRGADRGSSRTLRFKLPTNEVHALHSYLRNEQCSAMVAMVVAFSLTLYRHTGQQDQIIAIPMARRSISQVEDMLGYFNNIVPIRVDLSGNPTISELMQRVRRTLIEAQDHQNLPFQRIAELPQLARIALSRAMVSYQESGNRRLDLLDIESKPVVVRKDSADFDLALYVEGDGASIEGVLDFNMAVFSEGRIKRLLRRWLEQIAQLPQSSAARIDEFTRFGRSFESVAARIQEHPQIDHVVLVPDTATGRPRAYLVLNEHDVPRVDDIRRFVAGWLPAYRLPEAYIPLDDLPLQPDGAVDISQLPVVKNDRSRLSSPYLAPRTENESRLADIWKRVLWLDFDVGVLDDFTELGGHSLLSVQLVAETEKEFETQLPISLLGRISTIEAFASALDRGVEDVDLTMIPNSDTLPQSIYRGILAHIASWDGWRLRKGALIVGLNQSGDRQPLFWCLQRYGELTQLAKYLGEQQPVFGMRSGNRVMVKTEDNIELLARHYVGEILEIQPSGPYLVGGNCQAAAIAFQVAKQLQDLGHEITLLIMQERFVPIPYAGPVALLFGDESDLNPRRYFHHPESGWLKYYTGAVEVAQIRGKHAQFFREPNVQVLTEKVASCIASAQRGTFGANSSAARGVPRQVLPEEGYAGKIEVTIDEVWIAGTSRSLEVRVTNASPVIWEATKISGIVLMNRWLDSAGRVVKHLDGWVSLGNALAPGESVDFALQVQVPTEPGTWMLDVDLADEGVRFFRSNGVTPQLYKIEVSEVALK
jgi:acyl carrier protein